MTAACKSPEFRKKVDIPKKVACDFHSADKGKYHKEDIEMNEELSRIKKLAGMEPVTEKVELNASEDNPQKDARASDVSQAMAMAKLKKTVEDRDADDVDFKGLFTGVARGEISLDDKGKIAESIFGIIKELNVAAGIVRQKKIDEHNFQKGGKIFGKDGAPDEDIDGYNYEPKKKKKSAPDMSAYAAANKKKDVAEEAEEVDETPRTDKLKARQKAGGYSSAKKRKPEASSAHRQLSKKEIEQGKKEIDEYSMAHSMGDGATPEYAAKKAAEMQAMADRIAQEGGSVSHEYHAKIADLQAMADGGHVHEDMVDDMMGHDDYMGAQMTSCPHCGSPNSYDMESETCAACGAGNVSDMDAEYAGHEHMFEKDSLSRIMVEMIFTEMKKGKNAKEISEELSFAYDGVRNIVEVLKKKVSKITEMGRPRGGPHIENVDYWDKPDEHLLYIIKDAGEAAKALRGHDLRAEGKYLDQVNDASTVLYSRRQQAADMQEQGLPGYDAWKTASPYDNEPSESDVEHAHEMGGDYGMNYLHSDKMALAAVADLKNPDLDPEDRKGLWADLISDVAGTIVNGLENDGNMVLSDDEVSALALLVVKKHMMM